MESDLSFIVTGFINPISGKWTTGFGIQITDKKGGLIMSGTGGMSVKAYAPIDSKF